MHTRTIKMHSNQYVTIRGIPVNVYDIYSVTVSGNGCIEDYCSIKQHSEIEKEMENRLAERGSQ